MSEEKVRLVKKKPLAPEEGEYTLQIGFMEGATESLEERLLLLARREIQLTLP